MSTLYWPSTDTSWTNNSLYVLTLVEQPPWWTDNIGRDRVNLARARFFYATPYRLLAWAYSVWGKNYPVWSRRVSRSVWRPRWQRSPLHKRALARR